MTDTGVPAATDVNYEQMDLRVGGVGLKLATAWRDGGPAPVVFLHGFGSTKEDYLDIARQHAFTGRPFLAYDAPGCGETCCEDLSGISIPFLVETAQAVLDHAGIGRFHLVGHSMGGLTALLLAHREPDRVLSFIDIEGNLAPEDCFLSRQILTHPSHDDNGFLDDLTERARRSPTSSSALYAASLRHKIRPGAVRGQDYAAPSSGRERCIRWPVRPSRMSGSRRAVMTASCVGYPTRRTIWGYSANGHRQGSRRLPESRSAPGSGCEPLSAASAIPGLRTGNLSSCAPAADPGLCGLLVFSGLWPGPPCPDRASCSSSGWVRNDADTP